ncbi:glycosyltransferase family protein [Curtobacterium ammoniigenes]|uniref:glycosyltransferase family protein n=1 Tax=Curtobacterium ammoniigenes TaxID=395387 RepID=UPI0008355BEA|nr:glycosyltransferase [Curtobacterium ammoniigenes]
MWGRRRRAAGTIPTPPPARLPIATGIDPSGPPDSPTQRLSVLITAPVADYLAHRHEVLLERAWSAGADVVLVVVYDIHAAPSSTYDTVDGSDSVRVASARVWATWGGALAAGLPKLTGRISAVLDTMIDIEARALRELVASVGDDVAVAQPRVLGSDDVVRSAGAALPIPGAPTASLLRGHPRDDGLRVGLHEAFAADEPCLAFLTQSAARPIDTVDTRSAVARWSYDSARAVGKRVVVLPFDRVYRANELRERRYDQRAAASLGVWRSAPDVATGAALGRLGLEVADVRAEPAGQPVALREPVLRAGWRPDIAAIRERKQRLRWSVKIAAHPGPRGDDWGDLFFARDLADALRSFGQDVIIDHRESHQRPLSEHLDDVSLVLRGLDDTPLVYGAINIIWVISHPGLVDDAELARFDLRYAAGPAWAAGVSARTALHVEPLLQATNPDRFTPDGPRDPSAAEIVFVGKTRGVMRPIVSDAIAAGLPVTVWGAGWRGMLPTGVVAGEFVDNDRLPDLYRAARIVLNDHWPDMAAGGFISNRIFDATAAGAIVLTDPVAGLTEVFRGAALAVRDVDELRRAALADRGSAAERRERALAIGQEHSFVRRARVLLDDVLAVRAMRRAGSPQRDDG